MKEAIRTISKGGFEIDFLMLAAAVGAAILDKWAEGALLLFLFSLGHALEHYALSKARKSIQVLTELAPSTALLLQAGKEVETLETADIALMADKLENLPFAIGLSRKSKAIIRQNLWISLGVVALLVPLTILELTSIGPAIIAHEGSTLVVVFNALRLLAYKGSET